jgi:hypothetical protein
MNVAVLAVEGWAWARAARRRFEAAKLPFSDPLEEPDRLTDLGQGIEALDRALRYAEQITDAVSGTSLPAGTDWPRARTFARRGRDALAHGDERLTAPGLGYHLRLDRGIVRQFGKAKRERKWRTDEIPITDLVDATDVLIDWFDREASI